MTKVSTHLNEYRHEVADCPFCDGWVYIRESTKTSPDPLRDLKRHITTQAKNEAFEWALSDGSTGANRHLEYVRAHYDFRSQRDGSFKRQYDSDLTL